MPLYEARETAYWQDDQDVRFPGSGHCVADPAAQSPRCPPTAIVRFASPASSPAVNSRDRLSSIFPSHLFNPQQVFCYRAPIERHLVGGRSALMHRWRGERHVDRAPSSSGMALPHLRNAFGCSADCVDRTARLPAVYYPLNRSYIDFTIMVSMLNTTPLWATNGT